MGGNSTSAAFAAAMLAGVVAVGVTPVQADTKGEASISYRVIRGSPAALEKFPKGSTIPGNKVICLTSRRDFLYLVSTDGNAKTVTGPDCGKILAFKNSRNRPAVSAGSVR